MSPENDTSRFDVHIGYLPPQRWDELPNTERGREVFGGSRERPGLTVEPIAWESLRMTPRWLGDDSSSAVAAIQPSNFYNRGPLNGPASSPGRRRDGSWHWRSQ